MQAKNLDEQTITLESEDGRSYPCRLLGVFEYDGKEYALLLHLGENGSTTIMRLIEERDQAVFRTIESDEEFERVVAFVKELAAELADD